ncbi:unnamed protein product [Laminaria digitata]
MSQGLKDGDVFWAKELREGMLYRQLGKSDLVVSKMCMGTMTWGGQNSYEETSEMIDLAFDEFGVNFVDLAEMYPMPPSPDTHGRTEIAFGKWLKKRTRHDVVVATKVTGRSDMTWLRDSGEGTRVRKKDIIEAVDKSLKRLGTDYIDLLQIHWPDRCVPLFGGTNERYNLAKERDDDTPFEEQLAAMDEVVRAGKVRAIGGLNETPYGVTKMAQLGERMGYPRVASVQNNYSLLCRADTELSTMAQTVSRQNADVGFLAYSPLAGGVLSGKYLNPEKPVPNARFNRFKGYMERYQNEECTEACVQYAKIAEMVGLTPAQLALAWVYSREFVASTIVGASDVVQLRENLRALNCAVTEPAYEAILKVYEELRDPSKTKR